MAGTGRGLSTDDIRRMEIGEFVDFCLEWNEWNNPDDEDEKKQEKTTTRKATQRDWDNFFGA